MCFYLKKVGEKTLEDLRKWRRWKSADYLEWPFLVVIVGSFFLITLYWAWKIKYNQSPDEAMRYMLPDYIFKNNALPRGDSPGVIYQLGNWSYAYYPQWIGPILSSTFMKATSIFSRNAHVLLFSARLVSVLAGTIGLGVVIHITWQLTHSGVISALMSAMIGFLPQYTYLSSYINNDILSCLGAFMIVDVLVSWRWSLRHILVMTSGMIICLLSYLNSYGFVLFAFIFICFIAVKDWNLNPTQRYKILNGIIVMVVGLIIFALPFFARNYYLYGDFFGMKPFHAAYLRWLSAGGQKLQYSYPGSFWQLLSDSNFYEKLKWSSIGRFGYLSVTMSHWIYLAYSVIWLLIFSVSIIGYCFKTNDKGKIMWQATMAVTLSGLVTIGLYFYYLLQVDFQAQGRYLITLLAPLTVFVVSGFQRFQKHRDILGGKIFVKLICVGLIIGILLVQQRYLSQIFI